MSNTTLNLTSQINSSVLTSKEKIELNTTMVGFKVNRWNFTIDGFDFTTSHNLSANNYIWINPIYQQTSTITLQNMDVSIEGNIMTSYDPMTLYVTNFGIDYYRTNQGFYIMTQWNYTNASLSNEIMFTNVTAYNSIERVLSQTNSFIYLSSNANFTLSNSTINLYASESEKYQQVYITESSYWSPNDSLTQIFTLSNVSMGLNQSSDNSRFVQIYSSIDSSYFRKIKFVLNNLSFADISMNTGPLFVLYANNSIDVYSNEISVVNSTFQNEVFYFSQSNSITLNNLTFKNITELGESLIIVAEGLNVDINRITIASWTLSTDESYYYYQHTSSSGYTNITGLVMTDTDLKNRKAVYLSSVSSLVIKNSTISNSEIYSDNYIFQTSTLGELEIDGLVITGITSYVTGDDTNCIMSFSSFNLSSSSNYVINNVTISQSNLAFLSFNKIVNTPTTSKTFTISNFQYSNSSFYGTNSIMSFSELEDNINFSIILSNIKFNTVSFNTSGNLLYFQQQLNSSLTITNLSVSNTNNAIILLDASNNQNTDLPVKVSVLNMTTSLISNNVDSLFTVADNVILYITSSTIQNITSGGIGAFWSVNSATSQVYVYSSTFKYNNATEGGVFNADSGVIRAYNSQFLYNNASSSGLIKVTNSGWFELYSCTISSNYAQEAPISLLFDSSSTSVFNNCTISSNNIGSNSGINTYPIQLISAEILITNNTSISNQYNIVSAFVSTVVIENSSLLSSSYNGTAVQTIGSTFNFTNITLKNLTIYQSSSQQSFVPGGPNNQPKIQYILQCSMYSEVYINAISK